MVRPAAALLLGLAAAAADAHPLAPSLLEIRERAGGPALVTWKVPALQARGARLEPVLPARCRPLAPPEVADDGESVRSSWPVECGGLAGEEISVRGLESGLAALVRVVLADGRVVQGVVTGASPSLAVPAVPAGLQVLRSYGALGVRHILGGPDHLLFVLGLILLARTFRRVVATVTAFTLGHSVTLSLAVLGVVRVPTRPLEVAIAASVLLLAIELTREPATPTLVRRAPWVMALVFGLLHGLGFAGALSEAGLPAGEIPLALLAFNLGVEAGQVAFVVVVLGAGQVLGRVTPRLPRWVVRVPLYVMGSLAAFWCFERLAAALG